MNIQSITSSQNPRYRAALKLKTSRGRKQQQRFIIFGEREVKRAIGSGIQLVELFVSDDYQVESLEAVLAEPSSSISALSLSAELWKELQFGDRGETVAAVASRPDLSLEQLSVPKDALVVVLQGIEKPGNIGAVLRSMDAVAADALVLADPQCDAFHPNSIRSSMGSVFTIPLGVGTTDEVKSWCKSQNLTMNAATNSAATRYTDGNWTGGTAFVLGNEASGLSDDWLAPETNEAMIQQVSIPMQGICDSLNVSVAAAVLLFEARRQRS